MMGQKNIFLTALVTLLLLSCSDYPQDAEVLRVNPDSRGSQSSVESTDMTISPENATARTVISLKIHNTSISNGEVQWYINGNRDRSSKGFRLSLPGLQKGDVIQATIVSDDKEYRSNEIRINNTPPVIHKSRLLPQMLTVSSTLTVELKADDADNDTISYTYKWTRNGTFAGEESHLDTELKRDDAIMVEVTPFDGEEHGRSIFLKGSVMNSLPLVSESTPSFDGNLYTYQIAATDPDGDQLVYTLEEGPEGMNIDESKGIITWEVGPEDEGMYEFRVSISDNKGGKIEVPTTTRIGFEE